jgi:dihydrofolate reductase
MRRLIVTENTTINGMMSPIGDWFRPTDMNDEMAELNRRQRATADAMVIGRVTYEEFVPYWPNQHNDPTGVADYLNSVAKYVVSSTLVKPSWQNTTVLSGPMEKELANLKAADGADITVTGSTSLVHALLRTDLVDVVRTFAYPVVQGDGHPLFPPDLRAKVQLMDVQRFETGVLYTEYAYGPS